MRRPDSNTSSVVALIRQEYERRGIEPLPHEFRCDHRKACEKSLKPQFRKSIIKGNWPYIGCDYGKAEIGGIRCRILVIGMDQGGVGEARGAAFEERQEHWYWAFHNRDVSAHTGGTHLIIKCLVDNKDPECFLRQFAHTNSVKCSPEKQEGERMKSESTPVMQKRCRYHLKRDLEIFEPDLVITEGRGPTDMVKVILNLSKPDYPSRDKRTGRVCEVYRGRPVLLAGPHPARTLRWRYGTSLPPYYARAINAVWEVIRGD